MLFTKPYRDGGRYLNSWDIKGLKKGIFINGTINNPIDIDNYWTVKLVFPWEVLDQFAAKTPKANDQWKVNFSRVNYKMDVGEKYTKTINPKTGKSYPEFNWVWSPQPAINMHMPEIWGLVQFSDNPVGSKGLKFIESNDESIKLLLREVYYALKKYREKNKTYTNDLAQLETKNINAQDKDNIEIQTTISTFEATYITGDYVWHTLQDGKIWRTNK